MHRLAVALLAVGSLGVLCVGPTSPPEPDACGEPAAGAIASLEIGPESSNGQPFVAWAAADTAYVTSGDQGGNMVGVTLRVGGAGAPDCLAQTTRLRFRDQEIELDVPVRTYEQAGSDARVTQTVWLIFDGVVPFAGDTIEVSAAAGGLTASSVLTVVADRHELVALTATTPAPRVGDALEFRLDTIHRPAFSGIELQAWSTDPAVLGVEPLQWAYEDQSVLSVQALAAGSAELVVSYGEQELRAAVEVAPR